MSRKIQDHKSEDGFTMVEIAIVILVVGFLIGGILMAWRFVLNAQLYSTYSTTQIYGSALEEFIQIYDALPGDMNDAVPPAPTPRLANFCGAACVNGGGDNVVGDPTQPIFAAAPAADETTQFWFHLQAAELINAVAVNVPPAPGTPWGQALPAAKAGGGFQIRSMGGQTQDNGQNVIGIFVRWQQAPWIAANTANGLVVRGADAAQIDRKFDDASPLEGSVRARGTANDNAADNCKLSATQYNEVVNAIGCYMYFQIRTSPGL